MVSGSEGEMPKSKIDPCGVCGKRVMSNSIQCLRCGKWVHGRCAKMQRVAASLAKGFVCARCKRTVESIAEPTEELGGGVETVDGFCYLGDRLNASGGCEVAVTARTRLGWIKFRECGHLLRGKRFPLNMKGGVYRSCVRSAMLYGSETWCLMKNELAILRRTERAMVRAMCGVKLMDKRSTEVLMDMLGLEETVEGLARANGVRWFGHVLRRDESVLRKALYFSGWAEKERTTEENMEETGGRAD